MPIEILICNADKDSKYLTKLIDHLKPLEMGGVIKLWHAGNVLPGSTPQSEISQHIHSAHIILLLISSDFFSCDYYTNTEIRKVLAGGQTRVIPIFLRSAFTKSLPFSHLRPLPSNGKPIANWTNQDDAFLDIVERINIVLKNTVPEPSLNNLHAQDTGSTTTTAIPETNKRGTLLQNYKGHTNAINEAVWEPGGSRIATAGLDGTVQIWDAETGHLLTVCYKNAGLFEKTIFRPTIWKIAWSPDGKRIAACGNGTEIEIWDTTSGQKLMSYQDHADVFNNIAMLPDTFTLAWSPDGKSIASACSRILITNTIHIWNSFTGQKKDVYKIHNIDIFDTYKSIGYIDWSHNGKYLAAVYGCEYIRIWHTGTKQVILTHPLHADVNSIAWSPDDRYLAIASGGYTPFILERETGSIVATYLEHKKPAREIAWSPDGEYIATASNDRTVQIWRPLTGRHIYTYRGHADCVAALDWSPDGTRIVSAGLDRIAQIWRAR